jgi:hypothetical protein
MWVKYETLSKRFSFFLNFIHKFIGHIEYQRKFSHRCIVFSGASIRYLCYWSCVQTHGDSAKNGFASFVVAEGVPRSFRLGVMLDNADDFNKTGKYLWLTNSANESSGKVALANSNRVPDWYFFDLTNI